MGDIYRNVKLCVGRRCRVVPALLDSDASKTVIGRDLARALGAKVARRAESMETAAGRLRAFDATTTPIQVSLVVTGCPPVMRVGLVVDDELAAKAAPTGEMILGTDYMQQARVALLFGPKDADHLVVCSRRRAGRTRV